MTPAIHPSYSGIALRPSVADDRPLLLAIYASARADELAMLPWSAAQREAFVAMQFAAQQRAYREAMPDAAFAIVELHGAPIGRLDVHVDALRWSLVDITLLPEHRGAGIGAALIRDLQRCAQRDALPLRLHVEQHNRALGLYRRLGFRPIETAGIYLAMEWTAEEPQ